MPKLTIDNQIVEVPPGATILTAARQLGIPIPTLCYLEGQCVATSCLVCVVKVNGGARLTPACATAATEGMVVESETEDVLAARRMALELLLGDHLGDCIGPCQGTCPAQMDIPTMIRQLAAGDYRAAIATVKAHIPLPATLGRICPSICERGCRRAQRDAAVSICLLKRFVADMDLASPTPYRPLLRPATGKRVAIIGAGPAGLSATYFLQQWGHACTVLDARERPGGMLRYGVSPEILPPAVLDAEIARIRELGVCFQMEQHVAQLDQLRREYDAVLLATGTRDELMQGLAVEKQRFTTDIPGVFAAGAAVSPTKHAVRAVADGREAAIAITQYLAGQPVTGAHRPFTVHMGRLQPDELDLLLREASADGRITASTESGLTPDEAQREAERCLHCDCRAVRDCKLRQYAEAYQASPNRFKGERAQFTQDASHPLVIFEAGKCINCGLCVQITEHAREPLGLAFIGRGFTVRPAVPFGESYAAGLRDVAQACARACPTGALVLREKE